MQVDEGDTPDAPIIELYHTIAGEIVSELPDGKVGQKIESKSNDEIGQRADVLERLRVSLKAAMDRPSRQ